MLKKQHDDAFDERGVLRDGGRIRVPMLMMDSATDDGAVRDDAAPARLCDAFGDSGAGLHRPGSRHLVVGRRNIDHPKLAAQAVNRADAYRDSVQQMTDAWKGDGANAREIPVKRDTGNPVADAWGDMVEDLTTAWRCP